MKKSIVCLVFLLTWANVLQAQFSRSRGNKGKYQSKQCTVIGFGWNYAVPVATGFDAMLTEFNDKFATNDGKFSANTPFQAGSLVITSYGNHGEQRAKMWYEFGLRGGFRNMQATEKIDKANNKVAQQLYAAQFGVGMLPVQTKSFDLALAITGDGGLLRTQASGKNAGKEYTYSQDNFFYGLALNMPIYIYFGEHISLGIRPYYQVQLNVLSFQDMRKVWANNALPAQDRDLTASKFNNFGVYAHLNIAFKKVKDIRK